MFKTWSPGDGGVWEGCESLGGVDGVVLLEEAGH